MSGARRLVLLRHGRTSWNAARRVQGQLESELDETGHREAAAVAPVIAALAPAALWSSDSARARQTAAYLAPSLPTQAQYSDPVRISVGHLLSKAYTLPCSTAAQAFSQLVQPTARFQLALDALLPLLDSSRSQVRFGAAFRAASDMNLARATYSRVLHFIFSICTPSDSD